MIKPFLQNQQVARLNSIIDEANKTFLKESRLSNNNNFNILRVLSAFRLMDPQSPQSLYNAIIYITKNYNPTSFNQWKAAVNELSKLKRNVQKQKHNVLRPQILSYMKTYQNSINKQRMQDGHFQSKSFAQIKIPADLSLSDEGSSFYDIENKDISQTNAETGKRQYYTKTDTTQFLEKNHYISFQPYHHISGIYPYSFQKENVNSTNIGESRKKDSSYQYIEAIKRDLAKTNKNSFVKSPIDQSFIKNIDSYESPYLHSQPELLPVDPQEQQMNERAQGFLRLNLLFKSFSTILANTLVLQKAKQYRLKAQSQNRSNILQKSFEALKINNQKQKIERQKERKVNMHYSKLMKKKVLSVFRLIFDLRNKQNLFYIERLNRFSYEFVLNLLLSTQKMDQNAKFDWIDFNQKIEQLINNNQIERVCQIVKYFGNHSWICKQNFKNLIRKYRLSICKLVFKAIKSQQQQNAKFETLKNQKLIKKVYFVLKSRWLKTKSYNSKVLQAKCRRNQALQQKVMNTLLQMVYSTKLYSKRFDYLQKKTDLSIRIKLMGQWLQKAKQKSKINQILKENIKISQLSLNKFYKSYAFRKICSDDINLVDKLNKIQDILLASNSKKFFRLLKNSFKNNKYNEFTYKSMIAMRYKLSILKWKSKSRKGKGIGIVFKVIKKYYFRSLISPVFKQCIDLMNQIKETQMKNTKLFFSFWKNWSNDQVKKYEIISENFFSKINFIRKMRIMKLLQTNYQCELKLKKKQEIKIKSKKANFFLEQNLKRQTFFTLSSLTRKKQDLLNHEQQLNRILSQQKKIKLFLQMQSERYFNMKAKTLMKFLQNKSTQRIMDSIYSQLLNFKKNKVSELRKKEGLKQITNIVVLYNKKNRKSENKAEKHLNQTYLSKAIIGFYELIRQRDKIIVLAQQINQNLRYAILKKGIDNLRSQNKMKKIKNHIEKKHLFFLLKKNKQHFENYHQLCLKNRDIACKQVFLKLKNKRNSLNNTKQIQQKMKILQKLMLISRIQVFYAKSLISKKYLFMSVKYRALKICSMAFNLWKNRKYSQKIIVKQNERMLKGKERLSTDIMD